MALGIVPLCPIRRMKVFASFSNMETLAAAGLVKRIMAGSLSKSEKSSANHIPKASQTGRFVTH
jgi:hypothetical protein